MKYACLFPDASPESIYELMTDEDCAEFDRLDEVLIASKAVAEHAAHKQG
ncbi:hypothetical protein ACIQVO_31745 [Streptomyces sp. NPDC101062]